MREKSFKCEKIKARWNDPNHLPNTGCEITLHGSLNHPENVASVEFVKWAWNHKCRLCVVGSNVKIMLLHREKSVWQKNELGTAICQKAKMYEKHKSLDLCE